MARINPFLEALRQARRDADVELAGMSELKQFCAAIEEYIGSRFARCSPVPGANESNYGQEYKAILTFIPSAYTQTLLRAYLKRDAAPYLDVQDGKGPKKCRDVDDFSQKLRHFLTVPTVLTTLDVFRREAAATRSGE